MKFLRENKNLMKAILVLAIPAIFENVLQFFIGVVDMYFVGSLGKEAISAVGGDRYSWSSSSYYYIKICCSDNFIGCTM